MSPATSSLTLNQAGSRALIRAFAVLLTVVWSGASLGQAPDKQASTRAMPAMRYAEAMEFRKPQGLVRGVEGAPQCAATSNDDGRFADAVAYAEAMESYSLLIWQGGTCRYGHYFEPYDADLRPESASMHKSVAAILVAAAIADGHIGSADDPVERYLPAWRDDPRGAISLRSLLTMSSGLEPLSMEGGMQSDAVRFMRGGVGVGSVEARNLLLSRTQLHEPDTVFHYQGVNTQLLLLVIEAATGQRYVDYLSQRLWQPLGNRDAYVWLYDEDEGMPRAFSALMATAEDWLRVGQLILNRGEANGDTLIPAALIDEMSIPAQTYANYGWQIWLGNEYEPMRRYTQDKSRPGFASAEPFAVDDMIYFDGFGGQRVYISRKLDLVVVRQGEMRRDWDDARLPNLVINALGDGTKP